MKRLVFIAVLLALFAGCSSTGFVVHDASITSAESQYSAEVTSLMIDAVGIISTNEAITDVDQGDLSAMQKLRIKAYALDYPSGSSHAQKRLEVGFDYFVDAVEYAVKARNVYDNSGDVQKLDNVFTSTEANIAVDQYVAFINLYQENLENGKDEHVKAFKLL